MSESGDSYLIQEYIFGFHCILHKQGDANSYDLQNFPGRVGEYLVT